MEYTPKRNILSVHSDTLDYVYRNINLGKPGEMEEAIKTVREWIDKQEHFKRKDFSYNFLRSAIIASKGSIEGMKQRLDKICTLRTLMPDIFKCYDVNTDFTEAFQNIKPIILPKLTKEHFRVFTAKIYGTLETHQISNAMRYTLLIADFLKQCDVIGEYIGIYDFTEVNNMVELISRLNIPECRRILTIYFEGHGMRLKGIYFVTTSKVIDTLIAILKQILKPKIFSRIRVFKTWDEIYDIIGKDIIPVDFGGNEKSEQEIHDDLVAELGSEEFKKYWNDINSACTDETFRTSLKFNEEYAGMPGTFRLLSVD